MAGFFSEKGRFGCGLKQKIRTLPKWGSRGQISSVRLTEHQNVLVYGNASENSSMTVGPGGKAQVVLATSALRRFGCKTNDCRGTQPPWPQQLDLLRYTRLHLLAVQLGKFSAYYRFEFHGDSCSRRYLMVRGFEAAALPTMGSLAFT